MTVAQIQRLFALFNLYFVLASAKVCALTTGVCNMTTQAAQRVPMFGIRGHVSGVQVGTADSDQDLELWFVNHPSATEVTRITKDNGQTVVAIGYDE